MLICNIYYILAIEILEIQSNPTCVSLNRGVEHELSLIWGPVQNQIVHFRRCSYAGRLGHSALLAKAYQENTLDIGLDTFSSLLPISAVRECITKPSKSS